MGRPPAADPTMPRPEFIRFDAVTKTYDGHHTAVRQLDLAVREGEFLTLLGPSGCGKTTTLMMLAGFESPTAGAIHLDGRRIDCIAPHRRDIGMVFQSYALFPHMTVADNIAFPLRMRRLGARVIRDKVDQALDMVRLQGFADRKPAQLSGGQQQRVALARALVFEPRLVLMDEPLGALDKPLREHMQWEIKRLHARLGITVIYVTHDQGEALAMSDRIGVMKDGALRQLGPPATLYTNPADTFVARFIGENNALSGQVRDVDGEHCTVRLADGTVVQARRGNGLTQGAHASLTLRPENIVLSPALGGGLNTATATIVDLLYYGDHLRLSVHGCGARDMLIKAPPATAPGGLAPGSTISIGWRRDDCLALPMQ